jgi:Histidine kinase-, DNA gyrase B-, and HSP90-like ATPase
LRGGAYHGSKSRTRNSGRLQAPRLREICAGRCIGRAVKKRYRLGLNIVKQIVTRLGGNVTFDDAPGGGTVFQVDLPR